jgi:glycerate 2-kinase
MTMSPAGTERLARLKEVSRRIRAAAMAAADPYGVVKKALAPEDFNRAGRLFLLAVGKAAALMTAGAMEALRECTVPISDGLVVQPRGYPAHPALEHHPGRVRSAGHPVPDADSLAAAAEAVAMIEGMAETDTCLFLLSGGGSSLLSSPHPPLSLEDLAATNRLLLASGAGITEINTVRRHLSSLSGGRLAARCQGTLLTLAVSDVVGDDPAAIASGPTVADPTTFHDALGILESRDLLARVPPGVRALLDAGAAGKVPETPKQLPARHTWRLAASGQGAVEAAAAAARELGFTPRVLTTRLEGEAREAGRMLGHAALDARAGRGGITLAACLVAAGETTVTVRGAGKGGRNQELALAAAGVLEGVPGVLLTSFATDGVEGNTNAAGAYASGATIAAGRAAGVDAEACLAENDSHSFMAAAGELIVTGPTGTNVNDITFILVEGGT